jgi:hypothetical protein
MPGQCFQYASTASFQILSSSSSFIYHPTIRRYVVLILIQLS